MTSATSHIEWIRQHKGLDAAYSEACAKVREQAEEINRLWQSRFFEVRTLQDGAKKLWPVTEDFVSRSIDQEDLAGEPAPQFMYCDIDGQIYPVTVGEQTRHAPDPEGPDVAPFIYASAALIANGKVVGHVQFTDH